MDRFYSLQHTPIEFHFRQSPRDFVVDEIPLYPFSGEGEHFVFQLRKKNLTTLEVVGMLSKHLGVKSKEIGYAGLKDKNALTKQYFSIHKSLEEKLKTFENIGVKILETTYHDNKIKTGHLQGNRFFIRLKKVTPLAAKKMDQALKEIKKKGMPNFFGYQRFGMFGDNHIIGEKIAKGEKSERNKKLKQIYISSYQSHLFNLWLSKRLEISALVNSFETEELTNLLNMPSEKIEVLKKQEHPFKMLQGDLLMHYPYGRVFYHEDEENIQRFNERDVSITGLLCGERVKLAQDDAYTIEKQYDDEINADGVRRYAWIYPTEIEKNYREEEAWYELHFTLPKGAYATVLIEELAKRPLKEHLND